MKPKSRRLRWEQRGCQGPVPSCWPGWRSESSRQSLCDGGSFHFGDQGCGPAPSAPYGVSDYSIISELENVDLVTEVLHSVLFPGEGKLDELPVREVSATQTFEAARVCIPFGKLSADN